MRLYVYGEAIILSGSLNDARRFAEIEIGEALRWEQVNATRHEAWTHRE